MKKSMFLSLFLLFAAGIYAQSLLVGTYNIRNDNADDVRAGNGWARRCPVICNMINFEQPDVFGTQEALNHQLRDMTRLLPGYAYIGIGREDGKKGGEYSAIFYQKDRVALIKSGNFWLNETPDKPVLGWDAACVRICTWGRFMDRKTQKYFCFFNLHMDHVGVVARREAAKLVMKKIREIAGHDPVILTGDFNVDQTNEIYRIFSDSGLLKDAYAIAKQRFAENGTFNDFKPELKTDSRIDHIFLSSQFEVLHYGILTNSYWTQCEDQKTRHSDQAPREITFGKSVLRTPSDHYPVLAKVKFVPAQIKK
nr:endonuclease/exonuclease/phosphatase family protein [Hoylesella enoeca]